MNEKTQAYNINDWTFKIRDDTEKPVPWVYEDVRNCGYNFASEISIERIILEVEEVGKSKTLSLTFSDFEGLSGEQKAEFLTYNPKTATYGINVANFAVYKGRGKLLALKTKKDVLLANNVDGKPVDEPLYLFFTILFGEYGIYPPHEFTGALAAARFTPAVRFETMNDSVKSIRVHYRFHFDVGSYLKDAPELTKLMEDLKKKTWGKENYASLIRDADHFPSSVLPTIKLLKDVFGIFAEREFFDAQLEACKFEETCRLQTSQLKLELFRSGTPMGGDLLNISYHDPRTSVTDASKAFEETLVSLTDKKVGKLNVASSLEYDQATVDKLTEKIFQAIVGPMKPAQGLDTLGGQMGVVFAGEPLPGVSAACLNSNIKYLLVQLVFRNYCVRKRADLSKQLQSVRAKMSTDLSEILKYLEDDFEAQFSDIESLISALLPVLWLPVVGPLITLKRIAELVETIQKLAGKIISIASFDAAEKPVLYEVIGTYVKEGEVTDTWDNLHWWGTEEIPSAPGAFFAIHSHYRWTQLNAYPTADEAKVLDVVNAFFGTKLPLHYGTSQLRSLVKRFAASGLSGPLIDPAIPIQTISLAIALNGGTLDEELKKSDKPLEEIRDVEPQEIATVSDWGNSGKDIVYWLSCKAVRTRKDIFRGTLLVNGFYFAHDEEKPFSLFRSGNLFGLTAGVSLQKPKRKHDLFRQPDR